MELSKECLHQRLVISDKKELTCDAVLSIKDFTDELLTLNTEFGMLLVEGSGLEIESLSEQTGQIKVKGRIDGIYYKPSKAEGGFFSRVFK